MTQVNITEAAKLTGKSRTTLYRYIDQGKLTAVDGNIDTSELIRVFGEIREQDSTASSERSKEHNVTPQTDPLLQQLLAEKDKRIEEVTKDRDHWRDLAEEQTLRLTDQSKSGPQPAQVLIAVAVTALLLASVVLLALNSN